MRRSVTLSAHPPSLARIGAWLVPACPAVAWAADAPGRGDAIGPWLFACVALVLVGWLAWKLGVMTGRRRGLAEARRRERERATSTAAPPARPVEPAPAASAPAPGPSAAPARPAARPVQTDDAAAFSYALSHDLRAPLRVVEGFARILKEDYGRQLDRIGNDHLDRLLGASARMHTMIDGMLALARLSTTAVVRQTVDLSAMAHQVMDDLRGTQPERVVEVLIEPGLVAKGDPTLLRQLLDNLLGNAWKYSARAERARIGLRSIQHQGRAVLEFSDNGTGFDMRAASRLFGLFQRLHGQSDFPGTGLGLASVQRIVQRHGGQVWAEAEPGRGARFYVSLPD